MALDVERLLALARRSQSITPSWCLAAAGHAFEIIRRSAIGPPARPAKALDGEGQPVPYHNLVRPLALGVSGKQIEPFLIRAMPAGGGATLVHQSWSRGIFLRAERCH